MGRIQVSIAVGVLADALDPVPGTVRNSFSVEKSGTLLDQIKAGHGLLAAVLEVKLDGIANAQSGSA